MFLKSLMANHHASGDELAEIQALRAQHLKFVQEERKAYDVRCVLL